MHERALMRDVMREIEDLAHQEGASRVTCISVRLGALSHFTPLHFLEHFQDVSRGTVAEGAMLEALAEEDLMSRDAHHVILESVEIEVPDAVRVG